MSWGKSSGASPWLRRGWRGVVVVDVHGAIRLTAQGARVFAGDIPDIKTKLEQELQAGQSSVLDAPPTITIIRGSRLVRLAQQPDAQAAAKFAQRAIDETPDGECAAAIVERQSWL